MKDRDFLIWIHERLIKLHSENETVDYMHRLRAIIKATDPETTTPNINTGNSLEQLLKELATNRQMEKKYNANIG